MDKEDGRESDVGRLKNLTLLGTHEASRPNRR